MPAGLPLPQGPTRTVPYTFVASIAQGGMGYVELCCRREGRFLRWCGRKRIHESYRADLRFRSMFMDEARLAGLVRHPNVVGVSDVGEDDDGPYLIMDYVEGVSLSRALGQVARTGHAIPMQVAIRICREVALGLHAAHEARSEDGTALRLVHRDVSPQNVLIGFDGSVRVTDFGIAKALGNASQTNAGVLKGNMGYLSPEQLRFEEPDRRSDVFSLGVTLYELLSGARLYPNTDGFDGTRRILTEPPPDIGELRSDVPPELVELLFEMLAKEREARPATALEIAGRMEGILAVLIAEEGSVTVADYMDQHFALERQKHQTYLAEHLKRLNEAPSIAARTIPPPPMPAVAPPVRHGRMRLRWLSLGAVAMAGVVLLVERGAGSRVVPAPAVSVTRRSEATPSPPPVVPEAPPRAAIALPAAASAAAAPPA
ncbi:MAG TPA: serine/threonine-protein kinase, partial [Polyangia bacterium]|nr:serine/threonine-protein kinase [Polyangia bacterium]